MLPGRGDSAPKLLLVCEQQRGADEGRDTKHGALLAAQPASQPNKSMRAWPGHLFKIKNKGVLYNTTAMRPFPTPVTEVY